MLTCVLVSCHRSRGILKNIDRDSGPEDDLDVVVDFPEDSSWSGVYSDIELVPGCSFEVR